MRLLIVGSQTSRLATQIAAIVTRCGYEGELIDRCSFDDAAEVASRARHDILIVLANDTELQLNAIADLSQVTEGIILVIGPASNAKFVLQSLKRGATEFLAEEDVEIELEGCLHRIKRMARTVASAAIGKWISVVGASGGVGVSTIAANLAVALAAAAQRCLLLEIPVVSGDLASMFNMAPVHSLDDLCANLRRLDQVMFQQALTRHSTGVDLLPGTRTENALAITAQGVRRVALLSKTNFPYTVIDIASVLGRPQIAALAQSNLILVVMRLDIISLDRTISLLERLRRIGVASQSVRVVVNRYGERGQSSYRDMERALGGKLFHWLPNDPASVVASCNNGIPVCGARGRARFAKQIRKLAELVKANTPSDPSLGILVDEPTIHVASGEEIALPLLPSHPIKTER